MSQALPPEATSSLITNLLSRLPGSGSGADGGKTESAGESSKGGVASGGAEGAKGATPGAAKFDEVHGSVLALGLVASGACIRDKAAGPQFREVALGVAGEMCHGDVGVATAAARALGFMQLTGFEVLPLGEVEEPADKDGGGDAAAKVPKTAPKSASGGVGLFLQQLAA